MPAEYALLKDKPAPLASCPRCKAEPFVPFMRGMVQSMPTMRRLLGLPYCSVICSACKEIVGYEKP